MVQRSLFERHVGIPVPESSVGFVERQTQGREHVYVCYLSVEPDQFAELLACKGFTRFSASQAKEASSLFQVIYSHQGTFGFPELTNMASVAHYYASEDGVPGYSVMVSDTNSSEIYFAKVLP